MTRRNPFADPGEPGEPPRPPDGDEDDSSAVGALPADAVGGAGGKRITAPVDPERDLLCCRLPMTDLGRAERWRIRHGGDFRFCAELGWFAWDGRRWKLLAEEKDTLPAEFIRSLMLTVRAIRNEAALVAASGFPTDYLSAKEEEELEAWAEAYGTAERDLYLRGDDTGQRAQWLEDREPMDVVLGKGKLWSHKIAAWAKTSEGGGAISATLKWIKGFADVVIRPEELDTDPMAINVANGTIRLERVREKRPAAEVAEGKSEWRTGGWRVKLHKHDRADLLTKICPVRYNPRAKCPEYDGFLERVQPDPTMRRFLHQWGGYSLTGDVTEHKLAYFHGGGRNGKGTWVELVAHIAGDYAGVIGIESLLDNGSQRRGDQATPDLAKLPGVRFLRVSEPQKGMRFNDGLVKQLTGADPVEARHLNKGFFTFFPDFKLTISGNTRVGVKDVSHGMWSRIQLVPWAVIIDEDQIDRQLPDRLKGEAEGVLNRLIEGLIDWRELGLIIPEQVKAATRAYRDASDELGRFLRDLCEVGDDHATIRAPSGELHQLYKAWSEVAGGSGWGPKGFKAAMEDKGFKAIPSNGIKWLGVCIRTGVTLEGVQRGEWPGAAPEPAPLEPPADPLPGDWD